ncbi:MAG: hypothetical protein M1834_000828 [Cirrosporium novae-zelandiae]|nr:MAG: hypothetical protein M1834_000828 [Cirrosporium novae-zelandiae]
MEILWFPQDVHAPSFLPSSQILAPLVLVSLVIFYILISIKSWYRLRHIKGPWLGSISSLFMIKTASSGRMGEIYWETCKKYGPDVLMTTDPNILRHMNRARTDYSRGDWYLSMRLNPYIDSVLSAMDTAHHDRLRSQMTAGYAGKENPTLEPSIDEQILELISLIERKYLSSGSTLRPFDFATEAQYLTLDVITKLSYGYAFGYLKKEEDIHGYIENMENLIQFICISGVFPPLVKFIRLGPIQKLFGPSVNDSKGAGRLMRIAHEIVSARYSSTKPPQKDMLNSFISHGLTQPEAESEVLLQIVAGSDTTSTAIRSTFLHLLSSPPTLSRLISEIGTALASTEKNISRPIITSSEARTLPYLQACISEGLRIHPPFTGIIPKKTPPAGDTLNGTFIPGNVSIASCTWGVTRNPTIFGADAETFRPERWLDRGDGLGLNDEGMSIKEMGWVKDLVFGNGRWGCLGKGVALVELDKVVFELIARFEWRLVGVGGLGLGLVGGGEGLERPWNSVNYNLFMQREMWTRVEKREGTGREGSE